MGAVSRAVVALRAAFPIASLNSLLLSNTELIVVHANSIEDAPTLEEIARGTSAPLDHADAYYLMRWRRTPDGTLAFTSSGLPDEGWTPLAENSITRVDLNDLTVTTDLICVDEIEAVVQ
jgi:glutamine amidotransferase